MTRARIPMHVVGTAALVLVLSVLAVRGGLDPSVRAEPLSSLPTAANAEARLNATHQHREWTTVPISDSRSVLAWVVHPNRVERAPVVFLTGEGVPADTYTRAVSLELAAEGYLVAVPDVLTEVDQHGIQHDALPAVSGDPAEIERRVNSIQAAVTALPAAQDTIVHMHLSQRDGRIEVRAPGYESSFALSEEAWPTVVDFLNRQTGNRLSDLSMAAHDDHQAMMQQAQRSTGGAQPRDTLADKDPRYPAGFYTARATLLDTSLRSEFVDIPMEGTDVRLHTFVVYPASSEPTGVVLVMHHGVGLDEWQRALAVQVAEDGFIAVAADLWSGTGPNGGNWEDSEFIDDAMRAAAGQVSTDEAMRRYQIAREWAMTLSQANGRTGSIGFCMGGGHSFLFASEVPDHDASVVFYGGPPSEEQMARINAPVLGFYGENDARVTATVEPARAAMARLGKQYEAHVYPQVTHSFLLFQEMGSNAAAVEDAWPRTINFFRRHLL